MEPNSDTSCVDLDFEAEQVLIGAHVNPNDIIREYDMMRWYKDLEKHTAPSVFIPLFRPHLQAISKAIKSKYRGSTTTLFDEESTCLAQIQRELDDAITQLGGSAFVKLNTRSPKDAVLERAHPAVTRLLNEKVDGIRSDPDIFAAFLNDDNEQMIALLEAVTEAMRAHAGSEALELLTNSSRVQADVSAALRGYEESDRAPLLYLAARKWVHVPLQCEFRVFVCRRKITGAAQYFHMCYWPELVENKSKLEKEIFMYVTRLLEECVAYESCVIDVAIHDGNYNVIEINPFHFSTGAPLYGWRQGTPDRHQILYGPYELRVRTSPLNGVKDNFMATAWTKFFDNLKQPSIDASDDLSWWSTCSIL